MLEVEETVQQTEAIFRFADEVERRLSESGIAGVGELADLFSQLERALGAVGQTELEWATREAERLSTLLQDTHAQLAHLTMLKCGLGTRH